MKTQILVLAFIFVTVSCISQSKDVFTYSQYLNNKKLAVSVAKELSNNNYKEVLKICDKIVCNNFTCVDKYYLQALCYQKLGDERQAKLSILKAIENGYEPYLTGEDYLLKYFPLSQSEIDSAYKIYISSIDIDMRNKLGNFGMSYKNQNNEIAFLDSLISSSGWPGINKIGLRTNCNLLIPKKNMFYLFYNLNDISLLKHYYKIITDECKKFNEDWYEAESIVSVNLPNSVAESLYVPLNFIYLNNNNLDVEESLVQLNVLSRFLKAESYKITLYTSKKLNANNSNLILQQIKNELIKLGMSNDDIKISNQQLELEGEYYFSLIY